MSGDPIKLVFDKRNSTMSSSRDMAFLHTREYVRNSSKSKNYLQEASQNSQTFDFLDNDHLRTSQKKKMAKKVVREN